jgi:hypothetical protein
MAKGRSRSTRKSGSARRRSSVVEIPKDLAAAIKRRWPCGVVEQFDTGESYFHEIRYQIECDLRGIAGVSLVWQTEDADRVGWDDDEDERSATLLFRMAVVSRLLRIAIR